MAETEQEFHLLMQQVRDGSEDAARYLLEHYGEYILRAVRRRLSRRLRPAYDSTDFVQAVWASFFARLPEKQVFEHPRALIAFLATLAQNKVVDVVRERFDARKRDCYREQPLNDPTADRLLSAEPTPSHTAAVQDEWDRLLRDLPALYQRVLTLLRDGHTQRQIADELGFEERTIRRILRRLITEPVA